MSRWFVVLLAVGLPISSAWGQSYTGFVIEGQHNIYGAGFGDAPQPAGGGGGLPPPVATIGLPGPLYLTFTSVTGTVQCFGSAAPNGPDGGTEAGGVTNLTPHRDISGILHSNRTMFLVGVFRDSSPGSPSGPAPASLSYSDPENFLTAAPLLNQIFFIGDGRTDDTNQIQTFEVPAGATRLFLGFADGAAFTGFPGFYDDNSGSFTADFEFSPIPEPSLVTLTALGGAGCILSHRNRKRAARVGVALPLSSRLNR
jgi:hypothetical protein